MQRCRCMANPSYIRHFNVSEFSGSHFSRPQRSSEGYVFTPVYRSVHRGGSASVHAGIRLPPPTRSRQAPWEQALPPRKQALPLLGAGHPQSPLRSRSPSRRLLQRTPRILLECILVASCCVESEPGGGLMFSDMKTRLITCHVPDLKNCQNFLLRSKTTGVDPVTVT